MRVNYLLTTPEPFRLLLKQVHLSTPTSVVLTFTFTIWQ